MPDREISEGDFNLDLRNPRAGDELAHRPPVDLIADLISIEHNETYQEIGFRSSRKASFISVRSRAPCWDRRESLRFIPETSS